MTNHQSKSERRIAELEKTNKIMALEFDLFMKSVILAHGGVNGVLRLPKSTIREAQKLTDKVVKIEGTANWIEYSLSSPSPSPSSEIIILPSRS